MHPLLLWSVQCSYPPPVARGSAGTIRFGLTPVFLISDLELLGRLQIYLLLNAVSAAPPGSEVAVDAWLGPTALHVVVSDHGSGLPEPAGRLLAAGGETGGPPWGGGLGLWTTRRILDDLGASAEVERPETGGTRIRLLFPLIAPMELAHVA